ncbi:MAG: 3-dehydroquinate synthase [Bacteroidota bacterium]
MRNYPIHIGSSALESLSVFLEESAYTQILVLADTLTHKHCYPHLQAHIPPHQVQLIEPGEIHKNLATCTLLWQAMTDLRLDRRSLVINLGGGVIGDMGGFVASTYKRGIDFVQVPTTLLAQVDASVGGKLGIDFEGYKNHIGLFCEPQGVFIYPAFLQTLPEAELHSGFAEVIKHHLIADAAGWEQLQHLTQLEAGDMEGLIRHSIQVKEDIVAQDPQEKGLRKALNFGHTIGHAIEGDLLQQGTPILHGEAIAIGMVAESWISSTRGLLSPNRLQTITQYLHSLYPPLTIDLSREEILFDRARNDKKNIGAEVNCTLLDGVGKVKVNQAITQEEMTASLQFWNASIAP